MTRLISYLEASTQMKSKPAQPGDVLCGWRVRTESCPVEWSNALITWMRWEQRIRGKSRETGESVMCMEFVPHTGTRAEFMKEFIAKFAEWMPHVYRDQNFKFMRKLQLECMSSPEKMARPTMMITRVNFAARPWRSRARFLRRAPSLSASTCAARLQCTGPAWSWTTACD